MPIGEIAGEVLGGALKIIGRMIIEVIFEICVKGLGYLICRTFSRSIDPDGVLVAFVGIFAWAVIVVLFFMGYDYLSVQVEIDRCLDAGGSYDYENKNCNYSGA
jgi:hypothetical protein